MDPLSVHEWTACRYPPISHAGLSQYVFSDNREKRVRSVYPRVRREASAGGSSPTPGTLVGRDASSAIHGRDSQAIEGRLRRSSRLDGVRVALGHPLEDGAGLGRPDRSSAVMARKVRKTSGEVIGSAVCGGARR